MISFCVGELGLSLSDTYDMTWAEYCIRSHAYHRLQTKEWEKIRVLAWHSLIAPNADPKKLPKSIERFMPLAEPEEKRINDSSRNRFLELHREYLEAVKANKHE